MIYHHVCVVKRKSKKKFQRKKRRKSKNLEDGDVVVHVKVEVEDAHVETVGVVDGAQVKEDTYVDN